MSEEDDPTVIPKELRNRPDGPISSFKYYPKQWSIENKFRLPQDLTMHMIRRIGNEGIGRIEVGQTMGMDTATKAGNRKVSAHIQAVSYSYPKHIGQFQKMDGRQRSIRYFWKLANDPETFKKLFLEYERLTEQKCPFKLQQVVKFEGHKLNTLRISDVTMARLNLILRLCQEKKVIVSTHKLMKLIDEFERENGYNYSIDKRSLNKCTLALQSQKAINIYDTVVRVEHVDNTVTLYCHRDVNSDDEIIAQAVSDVLEEFSSAGRMFPHGQLKCCKKEPKDEADMDDDEPEIIEMMTEESDPRNMTYLQRYQTIKIQATRITNNPTFHVAKRGMAMPKEEEEEDSAEEGVAIELADPSGLVMPKAENDETLAVSNMKTVSSMLTKNEEKLILREKISWLIDYEADPISFGQQPKGIRQLLLHHVAWALVFGEEKNGVDAYTHHNPNIPFINWPYREVTELEKFRESPEFLQFVPPIPKLVDKERGWFMVQDVIMVMPLAVYIALVYIPKKTNIEYVNDLLEDPVKRFTPIGDLEPLERDLFMNDKKGWKQIEYHMHQLCIIGLAYQGTNPAPKRFPSASNTMFCLARKTKIYDTSTSLPGYTEVSQPLSMYHQYIYSFDTLDDVTLYWHHIRAVIFSTPLMYRSEMNKEQKTNARTRAFGMGTFDKLPLIKDDVDQNDVCLPVPPHTGVAGVDPAIFIHLKRHWELNAIPTTFSQWLIHWFTTEMEKWKPMVEARVSQLQPDWGNFIKWNVLDGDKRKSLNFRTLKAEPKTPIKKDEKTKPKPAVKKRKYEDILTPRVGKSAVRSRFSSAEKDQLILIRAVGFFLNPVYRFWLDPMVIRDLMYDYVPESRSKNVNCLLAAGVRELVRGNRLVYLQRIVKSLTTIPKMRQIRNGLATNPPTTSTAKQEFFKNAFKTAISLLKAENDPVPRPSTSDTEFMKQLKKEGKTIMQETYEKPGRTARPRVPESKEDVQKAMAATLITAVLTQNSDRNLSMIVLDKFDTRIVYETLQNLRNDGLVTNSKNYTSETGRWKAQIILSHYFRNFFAHRFDIDVIEGLWEINDEIENNAAEPTLLEADFKANIIAIASSFYDGKVSVTLNVDESLIEVFNIPEEASHMKQVRYLESINLQLEKISVSISNNGKTTEIDEEDPLAFFEKVYGQKPTCSFEEFIQQSQLNKKDKTAVRLVYGYIEQSNELGAPLDEILISTELPEETVRNVLDILTDRSHIIEVGLDQRRWALERHLEMWTVVLGSRRMAPRPWILANGTICPAIVRWISEGVLMYIVTKPGTQVSDVTTHFQPCVQPTYTLDIIDFLENSKCLVVKKSTYMSNDLSSPFDDFGPPVKVSTVHPTVDAINRFSKIFNGVTLLPMMIGDRC